MLFIRKSIKSNRKNGRNIIFGRKDGRNPKCRKIEEFCKRMLQVERDGTGFESTIKKVG